VPYFSTSFSLCQHFFSTFFSLLFPFRKRGRAFLCAAFLITPYLVSAPLLRFYALNADYQSSKKAAEQIGGKNKVVL